ncbi:hypothetical protein A3A79_05620 [Candidatus Gottesmanbacteria bacterium RIFCSPLOWO2_01_FULL_43_11b]|uniref:Uncharacterized protein n=1 Tax=Candidatus Gottesmanbacteria bacterium RIFCSPLOWO2_01_FULL_43_11b TaxID=1798392 RepID=A0A1F6AK37_9BACT|nr:MAG: hypothetical protein A3A79_05620 [Candidatus Gottesmanbacteria bacterium RIFCSPLOWO2_01_FULL_43_11b]
MLEIASPFPKSYYQDAEQTLIYAQMRVELEQDALDLLEKDTDTLAKLKIPTQTRKIAEAQENLKLLSRSFAHRN